MPAIAEATLLQQTVCLRPVAPDWLPIIGRAPGWENVYLATGGAKKGILFSTGMGKAIADLITSGTTQLPIGLCTPERFAHVEYSVRRAE
jgi:glycine/D-amino acid oxidase-like deaminating enzyme